MSIQVSIIVPTYNGAHKLESLFDALLKQNYRNYELIVAVDGSTDNTQEVLSRNRDRFDRFKVVESKNIGRAGIRNKGAAKATGDLLLFLDDDIRPSEELISQHVMHHEKYKDSLLSGSALEDRAQAKTEFQRYKHALSQEWLNPFPCGSILMNKETFFLTAANFSVEAKVFEALKGFNEELSDAEDMELGMRAYLAGYRVYFNKDVYAWHDESLNFKGFIKRQRQYREANMKLLELYPSWAEIFPQLMTGNMIPWKKILAIPFSLRGWLNHLDEGGQIMKALPWRMRYALYQRVVAAWSFYYPEKDL